MSQTTRTVGGLDLSNLDGATERERAEFRAFYQRRMGHVHRGLTFLLDTRPDALKRFRLSTMVGHDGPRPIGFGFVLDYAMAGYEVGVRYQIGSLQAAGLDRAQCLDGIAICALYCGPRGLETIARALDDYAWIEPETPVRFPSHWTVDPSALASGIDFTDSGLSEAELERIRAWYLRVMGQVPRYVDFLAAHEPEMLKVYRNRFETCLKVLPNQVLPATLIQYHATHGNLPGIREHLLLARGLGMTKREVLHLVMAGTEYGGIEAISIVDEAAGDVFASWP